VDPFPPSSHVMFFIQRFFLFFLPFRVVPLSGRSWQFLLSAAPSWTSPFQVPPAMPPHFRHRFLNPKPPCIICLLRSFEEILGTFFFPPLAQCILAPLGIALRFPNGPPGGVLVCYISPRRPTPHPSFCPLNVTLASHSFCLGSLSPIISFLHFVFFFFDFKSPNVNSPGARVSTAPSYRPPRLNRSLFVPAQASSFC